MFFVKLFIGFEYGAKNSKNVTGVCNCNDGNGVVLVNSSSEITSLCEKNLSLWCQFESQKKGVALSLLNLSWVLLNNFIYALWKRKLDIKYHILIRSTFLGSNIRNDFKGSKARSLKCYLINRKVVGSTPWLPQSLNQNRWQKWVGLCLLQSI